MNHVFRQANTATKLQVPVYWQVAPGRLHCYFAVDVLASVCYTCGGTFGTKRMVRGTERGVLRAGRWFGFHR
jgi:hypothetical protein